MEEALLTVAVLLGVAVGAWRGACRGRNSYEAAFKTQLARTERLQQNHDRQMRHAYDQATRHVVQLIEDFAAEREMLLNRIQAPIAAVGASFAMTDERGALAPPTPGHGFDDAPVGEPDASSADSARAIREARAAEIDSQLAQRGIVQAE